MNMLKFIKDTFSRIISLIVFVLLGCGDSKKTKEKPQPFDGQYEIVMKMSGLPIKREGLITIPKREDKIKTISIEYPQRAIEYTILSYDSSYITVEDENNKEFMIFCTERGDKKDYSHVLTFMGASGDKDMSFFMCNKLKN